MTDEEFVRALYKGILHREPDDAGLQHHVDGLAAAVANPERYGQLAEAFACGAEFEMAYTRRQLGAGSKYFLPDLGGVDFEYAVSIGSFCHAAEALKGAGMRTFSTPFDWLFSSPEMVAHCLEDDFRTFLDRAHYRPVPFQDRIVPTANLCHHAYYQARFGIQHVFNHHDPSLDAQYAHFVRSVDRFRAVLASPVWKLFVLVSGAQFEIQRLNALVSALHARTQRFVVMDLSLESGAGQSGSLNALSAVRHSPSLLAVRMKVAEPSTGLVFPADRDNALLDMVLKSFWRP